MGRSHTAVHPLIDAIIEARKLKSDSQVAQLLQVQPSVVSKVRNLQIPVSDMFRVRVQRALGWSLARIDKLSPPEDSAE